jgi:hypothetical protein
MRLVDEYSRGAHKRQPVYGWSLPSVLAPLMGFLQSPSSSTRTKEYRQGDGERERTILCLWRGHMTRLFLCLLVLIGALVLGCRQSEESRRSNGRLNDIRPQFEVTVHQ